MKLYKATKTYPEKLYHALCTIRPTLVVPERAFSSMNRFVTRIRNRINVSTLDPIIFMQNYHNKAFFHEKDLSLLYCVG